MGILRNFLGKKLTINDDTDWAAITEQLENEVYVKELAISCAINILAKLMTSITVRTYENNKEIKKHMYYLFNVEFNQNHSASESWYKFFSKLIYEQEALIIYDNGLYVADSYDKNDRTFIPTFFKNVTVGDFTMSEKTFYMQDVIFIEMKSEKIKRLIEGLYLSYGKLINASFNAYKKSKGVRGKYKLPMNWSQRYKDQEELQKNIREKFQQYFNSDNAVLPIEDGFDFTEATESSSRKTTTSSEINELIDETFKMVAIAFNMPVGILKGDISQNKDIIKSMLTINIKPYAKMLQDEINRKFYGEDEFLKGNRVRVDITNVQYINLLENANAIDVLFRDGFSHNEIMEKLDEEKLDEDWADIHFVTKNYMTVQEMIKQGKEGS